MNSDNSSNGNESSASGDSTPEQVEAAHLTAAPQPNGSQARGVQAASEAVTGASTELNGAEQEGASANAPAGSTQVAPEATQVVEADGGESAGRHRVKIMGAPSDGGSPGSASNTSQTTDAETVTPARPLSVDQRPRADLRREEVVRSSHPGDRIIRYSRNVGPFRRVGGKLVASLETEAPRSGMGRTLGRVKRVLIGRPISSEQSIHERLTKIKALAVLSSDALSSVAYATEEIVRVLILTGFAAMSGLTMPVGLAVMLLLAIVAASYRQTIAAYPKGGGSYIVAKDNLGVGFGLTAAASILIDYTMTVAVSISSGIAALYSLFPELKPYTIPLCLGGVVLITIANLRGLREAGNIFAVPTYLFLFGILGMIAYGFLRQYTGIGGSIAYTAPADAIQPGVEGLGLFLILRAFTQGCTALTGVEAIADGVPAFKPPEAKNANATLVWMAVLAITMFGGITFLAANIGIRPSNTETVLSQLSRSIFGGGPLWFYINITTTLILLLAANTAFSDFPRLSYFLARDKFMPHQYSFRGDRLAFSWGIVTLAVLACILLVVFNGDTTALIPLYTVGVFNSFTLSQAGMVRRWWRTRAPGWRRSLAFNLVGAIATFIVLIMSAVTKFASGAWIVIVLIPIIIMMFLAINRHYKRVSAEIADTSSETTTEFQHTFIVPMSNLNPVAMSALNYARSLSKNVTAVHITEGDDESDAEAFREEWYKKVTDPDVSLVIIESPYRSLLGPLLHFIDTLDQQYANDTITIVLPEVLPSKWWEYLLHNQSALRLKAALLFRPNTVVADMPYVLGRNRGVIRRSGFAVVPWGPIITLLGLLALVYLFFFKR